MIKKKLSKVTFSLLYNVTNGDNSKTKKVNINNFRDTVDENIFYDFAKKYYALLLPHGNPELRINELYNVIDDES